MKILIEKKKRKDELEKKDKKETKPIEKQKIKDKKEENYLNFKSKREEIEKDSLSKVLLYLLNINHI